MIFVARPVETANLTVAQPATEARKLQASTWKRNLLVGLFVPLALLMLLQLGLSAVMAGRIMPGVSVAGMNIGGKTRPEAAMLLKTRVAGSKAQLEIKGTRYVVAADQIGMTFDVERTLDTAFSVGRDQPLLPLQVWSAYHHSQLPYSYRLASQANQPFVTKLVAAHGQPPRDAAITIKNGVPIVEPDASGLSLDAQSIRQAAATQLAGLSNLSVSLQPKVQTARIRTPNVGPAVEAAKALLATPVTITYGDKTFKPTAAQMGEWISFQKTAESEAPGLVPTVNNDGIKHYLQSVAVTINLNPVNRKLNVQNGDSQEIQAGQDGLQLDQDSLTQVIAGAVKAKQPLVAAAPTKKVPFKTEYNRTVSLDYGKYIEVNLSQQHLWVYQDHTVIYDSPLTSGATGAGFPTVTGLFSIQAKQLNRNLNGYAIGYNYNVFVKYWMPFYGNYGLHDASWRSSFGGQDYYYGGSHGCVNLPEATAAFLYDWSSVGTPVWIHQ